MYQKDYILRMIEMLGELIAGILGLIKKGDFQQANQSLDKAYYDFLKKDASFFTFIPIEKLTDKLLSEHNYTYGHLEILSELFYAEAEVLYAEGKNTESLEFYEKSLMLCKFVLNESKTFFFDKQPRISLLKNRIAQIKDDVS